MLARDLPEGLAAPAAPVVLVVQDDVAERALAANHLRESGVDVVEAMDADEARRVLDQRRVDVVLADIETPSPSSGVHVLRWLHEHHPGIKAILASATEKDIVSLKGYGVFLSKPYRMVDLDHCLQRTLAVAGKRADRAGTAAINRPASPDRPHASPQPSTAPPDGGAPGRLRAATQSGDEGDESSRQWMAELSRQLGARAAQQQDVAPDAVKAARRAALMAYDRARSRRLRMLLGFAIGAAAGVAIAILVPMLDPRLDPLSAARPDPTPSVDVATSQPSAAPVPAVVPTPPEPPAGSPLALPDPPDSAASSPAAPALPQSTASLPSSTSASVPAGEPAAAAKADAAKADAATADQPMPADATPNPPLKREEVREVQARLRALGFNPGPIDGAAGAMTTGAVVHYQQARGQSQTGTVDRELLAQLRQDPTPQPAPRAARAEVAQQQATRPPPTRYSDPFEPVRVAGDRIGRWLQSLVR